MEHNLIQSLYMFGHLQTVAYIHCHAWLERKAIWRISVDMNRPSQAFQRLQEALTSFSGSLFFFFEAQIDCVLLQRGHSVKFNECLVLKVIPSTKYEGKWPLFNIIIKPGNLLSLYCVDIIQQCPSCLMCCVLLLETCLPTRILNTRMLECQLAMLLCG